MKKPAETTTRAVRPVSLRLPKEIVDKLRLLANNNRRSLNGQVEVILREHFDL